MKALDHFLPDVLPAFDEMDLIEQMAWEDNTDFLSLEDAGLEEDNSNDAFDCVGAAMHNDYFYDGESSDLENN